MDKAIEPRIIIKQPGLPPIGRTSKFPNLMGWGYPEPTELVIVRVFDT